MEIRGRGGAGWGVVAVTGSESAPSAIHLDLVLELSKPCSMQVVTPFFQRIEFHNCPEKFGGLQRENNEQIRLFTIGLFF